MNTSFGFRMNLFNLILELYFCQLLFFKRLINCEVIIHVTQSCLTREFILRRMCRRIVQKRGTSDPREQTPVQIGFEG